VTAAVDFQHSWWLAPKGQVVQPVWDAARRIETQQSDLFERLHKLEVLYDPYTPLVTDTEDAEHRRNGAHENEIASNVDTVTAMISTADVDPRVETDGADWDQQLRARALELYGEELIVAFDVLPQCRAAFKECAKKGMGLVKYGAKFSAPYCQQVLVENIVVDQNETRDNREPLQIHEWVSVDADELIAEFPKFRQQIESARAQRQTWRIDGRYAPMFDNQVIYLDSYRAPIGTKGKKGYRPGRHVKSLHDCPLLDDPWEDDFPYAVMVWSKRAKSWYGIGGAERIAGIQRALNRRNWSIEQQNNRIAFPTMFVRPVDANMTTKTSRLGNTGVIRGDFPQVVTPIAVSPETYQSRVDYKNSAREEFGLPSTAVHGAKPTGVDSAVALREYKDQTSDRYAPQQKGYERLVLDVLLGLFGVCKKLGKDAPEMIRTSRFGARRIKWGDVDLGDLRFQLQAASSMPRTPAGRLQFVIELAQAGVISTDVATRLMQHPDLESELSLYTAAIESAEECIDEIMRGKVVMPEPFMSAAVCRWRGQREYLKWRNNGAPENRLESLRQFVVQAAWIESQAANSNASGTAAAANGNAAPPGAGAPPLPQSEPGVAQPSSAFAPAAVNLAGGLG
jgi:hypothetical protein